MERIKQKLFKKITETYFREFQDTEFERVSLEDSSEKFQKNLNVAYDLSSEFGTLVEDLYEIIHGPEASPTLCSEYARELLKERDSFSLSVKNRFKVFTDFEQTAGEVADILKASSKSCIVGGYVRDTVLNLGSKDVDFVTDIPYDEMEKMFKKAGFNVQAEGKQFLVLIVTKDGNQYEIANYRKDGTYKDGRRPESVQIGSLKEDAERRDFTLNALYYNLSTEKVLDPITKGLDDAKDNVLRFIDKPKDRLEEDSLRAFRFYRLLKTKKLTPDPKSMRAVRERIQEENLKIKKLVDFYNTENTENTGDKIAIMDLERVRLEIEKML